MNTPGVHGFAVPTTRMSVIFVASHRAWNAGKRLYPAAWERETADRRSSPSSREGGRGSTVLLVLIK